MEQEQPIEETLQTYCDGLYQSDPDKIRQAFHPGVKITGYMQGELAEFTLDQLVELVD